jgi:hypothetical protein
MAQVVVDAVEIALATRVRPGQPVSGDRSIVVRGRAAILLGVVDGIGHGEPARRAATTAARAVAARPDEPLRRIFAEVHERLVGTRGAVMSLARVALAGTMTWVGIGNVRGIVFPSENAGRTRADLLLAPGVLGHDLPALHPTELTLGRHDLLIFASDGVRADFATRLRPDIPGRLAERVLDQSAGDVDDALVLVARWMGERRWSGTSSS